MHMCINKLKTYTCRHIWRIYTCNHGNFTVVNFTVTLVAALVSVHRTTKNDNTVLFATSQMSPLSLFYDNLKETVFSPYTMNQHFKIITHNKILHFFNFGKDTQQVFFMLLILKTYNSAFHQVSAIFWYCSSGKLC